MSLTRAATVALIGCLLVAGFESGPRLASLALLNSAEAARVKDLTLAVGLSMPDRETGQRYRAAVAADPRNFLARRGYGQWLFAQDEPVEAASSLEQAVAQALRDGPAHFHLGLVYLRQNRLKEAAAQFGASGVRASYLVDRGWREVERVQSGPAVGRDWTAAARFYHAAALLTPADLTLWGYLAGFYAVYAADRDAALTTWREAAEVVPDSPMPYRRMSELMWNIRRDAGGAVAMLEEAVRLAPGDAGAYLDAAAILRAAGDTEAAESWLRRAISAAPGSAEAHLQLGDLCLADGRAGQAIVELRLAVAANPGEARAYARLGEALRTMGLTAEARAAYRRAAELAPGDAGVRDALEVLGP